MRTNFLARFGKPRSQRSRRRNRRLVLQGNQHFIALQLGVVSQHLLEIKHQPGAIAGLDDVDAAQRSIGKILYRPPQTIGGIGKIEGNPCRLVDGESRRGIGQRFRQRDAQQGLAGFVAARIQTDDAVAGVRQRQRGPQQQQDGRNSCCAASHQFSPFHHVGSPLIPAIAGCSRAPTNRRRCPE